MHLHLVNLADERHRARLLQGSGIGSDADAGDVVTYSRVSGPAWLSVAADGTLTGTPANSDVGQNSFGVSVSDGIAPPVTATV